MKGDFTRRTDDPSKDYSRVLKQQGRVDLDADWNEQMEIGVRRERTRARDVIGRTGVPEEGGGFRVVVTDDGTLAVTRGRIYVDGILCSNEAGDRRGPGAEGDERSSREAAGPVPLDDQPELPGYDPEPPEDAGVYAVYLDVWERHVTHVEDPGIKEPALGGPDTATRVQTVAQVRREPLDELGGDPDELPPCPEVPRPWERGAEPRLAARADPGEEDGDRCEPPGEGGYRGLENRLYRVEIHRSGSAAGASGAPATFKWSRDNGSVLYAADPTSVAPGDNEITLERGGRDDRLAVGEHDWVEVLDRETELGRGGGLLARVKREPRTDQGRPVLELQVPSGDGFDDADLGAFEGSEGLKVRRWDHPDPPAGSADAPELDDGARPVREGEWLELEKGVEVRFEPSATPDDADEAYRTGDYWLVPARSGVGEAGGGDVLWPERDGDGGGDASDGPGGDSSEAPARGREGIRHHHCLLAVIRFDGDDWGEPRDCRPHFPPITELDRGGCCETVRPGESVQEAVDRVVGAGGGCVSLCRGLHRIRGPLRITDEADLVLRGEGEATVVVMEDAGDSGPRGGIVLEGAARVDVESMLLAGEIAGGLVRIGPDGSGRRARRVGLRDLTVLNLGWAQEKTLPAAVRMASAEAVTVEDCRLVGTAGVAAVWGGDLPDPPDLQADDREPGQPPDYGPGVSDLELRDTAIRYGEAGVFALRADGWRVERADVRPCRSRAWRVLLTTWAFLVEGEAHTAVAATRAAPEGTAWSLRTAADALFAAGGPPPVGERGTTAILAHLWRDSQVQDCHLQGDGGIRASWWVRGAACRNRIAARSSGLAAFWLHDARWSDNRVGADGSAAAFAGAYRGRIEGNSVRAGFGLRSVPAASAASWLAPQLRLAARAYGRGEAPAATQPVLAWVMLEEFVDLAGLRDVVRAYQRYLDATDAGFPGTFAVATFLLSLLGRAGEQTPEDEGEGREALKLPLVDLRVEGNRLECGQDCLCLTGFVPLGSLRIAENRLVTLTGRGVRVRAFSYLADAALVHAVYRAVLRGFSRRLRDELESGGGDDEGPGAARRRQLLRVLLSEVGGWRRRSETFLESDVRIEDNTVRSLRTGIDTNLFQVVVARNHVTMIERGSVPPEEETGVATGQVTDRESGEPVSGAEVSLSTARLRAFTGPDGRFRIAGVPAGDHTLRVVASGYREAESDVAVGPDEEVETAVTLEPAATSSSSDGEEWSTIAAMLEDSVVQPSRWPEYGTIPGLGGRPVNPEILRVIVRLEGDPALARLGRAMREGVQLDARLYADHLASPDGPLRTADRRTSAADAVAQVGNVTSDEDLREDAEALAQGLENTDGVEIQDLKPSFVRFLAGLRGYVDSTGILVAGAGGTIVDNRVVVPEDADPETRALGGIQTFFGLARVREFQALAEVLLRALDNREGGAPGDSEASPAVEAFAGVRARERDPVGVTDTRVGRNEVRGGTGHGISCQGVDALPDEVRDLRVVANEVREMAGAGVLVGQTPLVAGLEIGDNDIAECGESGGFSRNKGGIVVRSASECVVSGNRVLRCGEPNMDRPLFGIDLWYLDGLRLKDNSISANGTDGSSPASGGLRLMEVRGAATVHDNDLIRNLGRSLDWMNPGVAENVLGLILATASRHTASRRLLAAGGWRDELPPGSRVSGSTVGIVGFGNVGKRVGRLLAGFDVDVLVYDPYVHVVDAELVGGQMADLDRLLAASDVVAVCAELTEETRGMIGERELALMDDSAILVNAARGPIVDQDALVEAVRSGGLAGAGLDVFEEEPLGPDSELLALDDVVLTPHVAGTTNESRADTIDRLVENVTALVQGRPVEDRYLATPG
jgi:lactate dehydrogenase-like 2-hydroxyacid dehydrogenase